MSQCISRGEAELGKHLVLTKMFYEDMKLYREAKYIRCARHNHASLIG